MNIPETFFSVSEELRLFGLSCLSGAVFGVIWEIFRTLRLLLPHNSFLTAAEDVLFFALYAVFLMCFTTSEARGEFRVYYVIGGLSGFFLYILTLGSIVSAAVRKIIYALKRAFSVVTAPFRKAFVLLGKKAAAKFVGISEIIVQKFKKVKMLLIYPLRLMYNKKENKLRRNGNNVGEKIKKNKKIAFQRTPRKAPRSRNRRGLRRYYRHSQPRLH
ncbi:MAG: spore cortex biosynthesis protein YabQ [Ruminococcus sp.]|nr:spore cortex biosynthesis protein YabQ [Ruminococcus sp.]